MREEKDMEQWDDIKEKNNKGKIIIIVIIIIIIALLIGSFIIIKKNALNNKPEKQHNTEIKKEKTTKEDTKEIKKEIIDTTETKEDDEENISGPQKYINYIKPPSKNNSGPSEKLYNVNKVIADELTPSEKINYISYFVYKKHSSTMIKENGISYTYEVLEENDVKNAVEEVYGPGTYQRTVFNLGCGDYKFNENDGKYYSKAGCGGTGLFYPLNEIIDYTQTNNKLEITTAYVFYDGFNNQLYKDYDKKIPLGDFNYTKDINDHLKDFINNNKNNLYHIIYTFESNDGQNYYFKSFVNTKA